MRQEELRRLQKIESRIIQIAQDNDLKFCDIEFDVVPANKMFEIMAYGMPGQISSWKFGRDYERTRTIYEKMGTGLPYEVVVHTNPSRAYLMKDNTTALQALVIAHVVGHVAFFTMNQFHIEADSDIASRLAIASQRFEEYERKYGVDIVEQTIDAGHSVMIHSNPWLKEETEQDKVERIFERIKKRKHDKADTEFSDFFEEDHQADIEREKWNHDLYMRLKNKTPVEPQEDLLRYIIDHSRALADWQKDILEIIRSWGQYLWPLIKTKYMNEGWATYWHEYIMRQLFREGLLNDTEHAECNYTNSLVKAKNPYSMNPYLIGCEIWEDIERRWNKGQHGDDWEEMEHEAKKLYDDGSMKGREKMFRTLRTSQDWMFFNNFLTTDLVRKLKLYMYVKRANLFIEELVVADRKHSEIKDIIIRSFANSGVPKIVITDGNYLDKNELYLKHHFIGASLDMEYAQKTLEHICFLWNEKCTLETIRQKQVYKFVANKSKLVPDFDDTEYFPTSETMHLT